MRWIIEICVWKDFIWMRGRGVLAGLGGERESERERTRSYNIHVHMCMSDKPVCQAGDTSHVNRFWLTSPRSAGPGTMHGMGSPLWQECPAQGPEPQPLPQSRPEGQVWTWWGRAKEEWGRLCECVFHSWLVYQSLPAAAVASGTALCSLSPPSPSITHTPSSPTYHSLLPWPLPLPASCRCLPGLCALSLPSHSVLTARLLQSLCPHSLQIHPNASQQ